jgi:hypothetical protein
MLLGLLAGIVGVVGYVPYIRDILRGSTKPERASWLIWLLEYAVLFGAQLSAGAVDSLWLIGLQLLGVIIICALAYRHGVGDFTKQNMCILGCVCATLVLWYFTRSANLTILLLVTVEATGVALTVRKVYREPRSETLVMWASVAAGGVLGTAAVGVDAAIILYAYPLALVVMGLSVIAASQLGARRINSETLPSIRVSDIGQNQ